MHIRFTAHVARYRVILVFLTAAFLMVPNRCRADGLIVISEPTPIPNHFAFAPLEVTFHHVTVDIKDQIAVTRVDEEFYNPNGRRLEGTYIFPLPAGAHIDKFSMDIDGKMADAEMLDAAKARQIYEEIVRKYRDPALLEYAGRDAVKVHIFPIEPNAGKHIKLQYTQALKSDSGLVEYVYPLNTEKFSSKPLHDVSVEVRLECIDPIKSIYCPTHETLIKRDGDLAATVSYKETNVRPDTDFKVIYSTGRNVVGANLLTYRTGSGDGYFMLLASPGLNAGSKPQPKDVCFVLDTSGSMSDDDKINQAKKALRFCLSNMNSEDRFQVIRFSSDVEQLFPEGLSPADETHVNQAREFVSTLSANGGTALNDALLKAMELHKSTGGDRPFVVVFLTDGMPTVGESNEDRIVENARHDGGSARVFCFGIGTDVNTHLLDRVASETRGSSTYVTGKEDIEVKVSSFFSKIREPALTDVAVTFEGSGIRTSQIYPSALPDLFKGESLTVFGRYSGSGSGSVKITGSINGERREFVTDVKFTAEDTSSAFVPQLWAARRIGWLLDEIRLHGESGELKIEITKLARQYGIVTPYTAYLIMEDERTRSVPLSMQSFREMNQDRNALADAQLYYRSNSAEATDSRQRSGQQAVTNATNLGSLKSANNFGGGGGAGGGGRGGMGGAGMPQVMAKAVAATQPASDTYGYRFNSNYAQQVRVVNGRSFYQNTNVWTDSSVQSNSQLKQKQIKFGSDDYFALLKQHPEASSWLALGDQMDLVIDDAVVTIRPDNQ
jgi:Ca-activated chloride channel family protein